jgi:hypothetical protein
MSFIELGKFVCFVWLLPDGYLTEVNFIDGQALTPSDFGEFDDNGTWKPLAYTGTYGTNGFYLNGVGVTDESGNGNDWTNNNLNLSTSTETTYDQMKDTPSLVDTNAGNFAVLNPLDNGGNTVSSGNLNVTTAVGFDLIRSTFFVSSGKWYWEVECTDCGAGFVGVSTASEGLNTRGAETSSSATIRTTTGNIRSGASDSSYGTAVSDGDVMILALDMDNGKFYAGKNGTWFNSGNPATSTNPGKTGLTTALSPSISVYNNEDYIANFGQRPFAYTPPSGFLKLNTFNLPDSTIEKGQITLILCCGRELIPMLVIVSQVLALNQISCGLKLDRKDIVIYFTTSLEVRELLLNYQQTVLELKEAPPQVKEGI